jgi:hypothetical protein
MRSLIVSFQCLALQLPQPSSLGGSIQSVFFYLRAMALPGHISNELQNLDYNKIPYQKVQLLSIIFDIDVLFELPLMFLTMHRPSQM